MSSIPHIPLLRRGEPYKSFDSSTLRDFRTGEPLAEISSANVGLIKRDLASASASAALLRAIRYEDLVAIAAEAGRLYCEASLPIGEAEQSPEDYVRCLSATSGLPHSLVRANMAKIRTALDGMDGVVRGLTRNLGADLFDTGFGEQGGLPISYAPAADSLAVILPSNSPGVNSIWIPAIALKTPVVLKPGREEPWTPYRIIQAFIAAGCPKEAFSFYPTSHEGTNLLMRRADRAILFGDDRTCARYASDPRVETHGTGRSKVLVGEDLIDDWESLVDLLATSVAANGGRSCVNTSAIVVPRHADAIAAAVAERLAEIRPRPADDPQAGLAAFANPAIARALDGMVTRGLEEPGAVDVTARFRDGPRHVTLDGAEYLLPTLVRCEDFEHPLANTEFLFPYASVVELPQSEMLEAIGPSLVVSGITEDPGFVADLVRSSDVDRLNLGRMPTTHVEWDQPHEGNLFEFLFRRRAIQRAARG